MKILALVRAWPVSLTDWAQVIPTRFHCSILTKVYGPIGHDWLCFVCYLDGNELPEEYAIDESA